MSETAAGSTFKSSVSFFSCSRSSGISCSAPPSDRQTSAADVVLQTLAHSSSSSSFSDVPLPTFSFLRVRMFPVAAVASIVNFRFVRRLFSKMSLADVIEIPLRRSKIDGSASVDMNAPTYSAPKAYKMSAALKSTASEKTRNVAN